MHRGSLAAGDWIQLNGPFNLLNINSITFRVADAAAGRTAGSPLAAVEVRTRTRSPGRSWTTDNLVSTGGTADLDEPDVPDLAGGHARAVPRVPRGDRRPTGNNLFNLNWVEFQGAGVGVTP